MFNLWSKTQEIVGFGTYGVVYGATHFIQGEAVWKELRLLDLESRRRFARERDLLQKFGPGLHCPRLYYSDMTARTPFIVMERSPGGSLQDFVGQANDYRRCLNWLVDISGHVAVLHHYGVKYRDCKPSNLLPFHEDGIEHIRISDFGMANRLDTASPQTCRPIGTPEFMDPQAESDGRFHFSSDVYAMGKTILLLATGNGDLNWFTQIPGPIAFAELIRAMMRPSSNGRPSAYEVWQKASQIKQALGNVEWRVPQVTQPNYGLLAAGAVGLAAVLLLTADGTE